MPEIFAQETKHLQPNLLFYCYASMIWLNYVLRKHTASNAMRTSNLTNTIPTDEDNQRNLIPNKFRLKQTY